MGLMLGRKHEAEQEVAEHLGGRKFEDIWMRSDDEAIDVYKRSLARNMGVAPGFVGGPMIKAIDRARDKATKHERTR